MNINDGLQLLFDTYKYIYFRMRCHDRNRQLLRSYPDQLLLNVFLIEIFSLYWLT